ncbi:MAG: hypothetical protein ACJ8AT_13690 [Hyalangium sp.]|uniref:hypothetical protein n=1 Tax=Hyalangium sp. TaxID=2028555 RepID=UPI00389A01F3
MKWLAGVAAVAVVLWAGAAGARKVSRTHAAPQLLSETGLYSDFHQHVVAPENLQYSPQYPLWTDAAAKRRWFRLPPGTFIDGSKPDAWVFPAGTKFWKEFSFGGRRIETRYLERQGDGTWLYATYAWNADETEAVLVSDKGQPRAYPLGAGQAHSIPSLNDCKACHQGRSAEVLGFSALQLSPDRDPNALHGEPMPAPGVELSYLVKNKLLRGLPKALLDTPPRIAAANPTERTALGYLHGNCGHCHSDDSQLKNLEFALRHALTHEPGTLERAIATAVLHPVKARASGQTQDAVFRIEPGHPERSVVLQRMSSRYVALQMPPLGTVIVDNEATTLISRWIAESAAPGTAPAPSQGPSSAHRDEGQ